MISCFCRRGVSSLSTPYTGSGYTAWAHDQREIERAIDRQCVSDIGAGVSNTSTHDIEPFTINLQWLGLLSNAVYRHALDKSPSLLYLQYTTNSILSFAYYQERMSLPKAHALLISYMCRLCDYHFWSSTHITGVSTYLGTPCRLCVHCCPRETGRGWRWMAVDWAGLLGSLLWRMYVDPACTHTHTHTHTHVNI